MNTRYKTNNLFKILETIEIEEQRDILSILKNLSIDSERYKSFFNYLLQLTTLTEIETTFFLKQDSKIKKNYESILLDDMSITGEKYLNFILEYTKKSFSTKEDIKRIDEIISKLNYDKTIKEKISKYMKDDLPTKEIGNIQKILTNNEMKFSTKSFTNKIQIKIHKKFAFSSENGEYGIKYLKGDNPNNIHIFVNGFTNDGGVNNYKDWISEAKDILDENDTLYGYDWASGKELSKHKYLPKINFKSIIFSIRG